MGHWQKGVVGWLYTGASGLMAATSSRGAAGAGGRSSACYGCPCPVPVYRGSEDEAMSLRVYRPLDAGDEPAQADEEH